MPRIPYFKRINEFITLENGVDLLIEKVSAQEVRFRFFESHDFQEIGSL